MTPAAQARKTPCLPRILLLALVAFIAACATAPEITRTPPSPTNTAGTAAEARRTWEEDARSRADDLLRTARALEAEGDADGAVRCIDQALEVILSIPEDFPTSTAHLDFVARLIAEAEAIGDFPESSEPSDELREELPPMPEVAELPADPGPARQVGDQLPESDFPLVLNARVASFLDALNQPGEFRNRVETGLVRSGDYVPMIRLKLAAAGLPLDLAYLPLIESAFSVRAYSRARAHGMWQFIAATGRHYGLTINSLVDERRDPERSTEAAIAYLADLHAQFGDWPLALAAYNSGSGNVRRAIRRAHTRDFWLLRRYLPRETRNYVPAFMASVVVAKAPEQYGFAPVVNKPWEFDRLEVDDALDLDFLATQLDLPVEELRQLNPAIRRDLTPARRTMSLRLPAGTGDRAREVLITVPREEWAPRLLHTVRGGETLTSIAAAHRSTVAGIRDANGIRGSLIRPGQTLIIPRGSGGAATARTPRPQRRAADDGTYIVKANDTLWDIATSFGTSVDRLCSANGLSPREVINPGQTLHIPSGAGPAATTSDTTNTGTYRVRQGDTLYDIARRFGTSVSAIRRANGLRGSRIYPGDVIRIPEAASPPTQPAEAG